MTNTSVQRDYKHEYKLRQKRQKRLHADVDRLKAETFQKLLSDRNETFIKWLNNKIDEEIKEG